MHVCYVCYSVRDLALHAHVHCITSRGGEGEERGGVRKGSKVAYQKQFDMCMCMTMVSLDMHVHVHVYDHGVMCISVHVHSDLQTCAETCALVYMCVQVYVSVVCTQCTYVLTFHKDQEGISEDVDSGEEDQYGEQEGTYGVCYLPIRLEGRGGEGRGGEGRGGEGRGGEGRGGEGRGGEGRGGEGRGGEGRGGEGRGGEGRGGEGRGGEGRGGEGRGGEGRGGEGRGGEERGERERR